MFNDIYKGKKILVTGHQGFCGSWLTLWLEHLGAKVTGFGRPARTEPNHYDLLHKHESPLTRRDGMLYMRAEQDLRTASQISGVIQHGQPDLVIHLAAKAIVAKTFEEPQITFDNNVMGAVNLLEAVRQHKCVKGIVFITTDKVYQDRNWQWGYREESDELGGDDPYSVSKVCAEHIIKCYRENYSLNVAVVRAGNVIGGGDWSYKRLIPDIAAATSRNETVVIHTPHATRPWQHVLEALNGYLLLGEAILRGSDVNGAYNFGSESELTVLQVLLRAKTIWDDIQWEVDHKPTHPHMVYKLRLDNTKARNELGWKPVWDINHAIEKTIAWYKNFYAFGVTTSLQDIINFEADAVTARGA